VLVALLELRKRLRAQSGILVVAGGCGLQREVADANMVAKPRSASSSGTAEFEKFHRTRLCMRICSSCAAKP